MELADYLRALRRRWLIMALCVAASLAVAVGVTVSATKTYESTARLFVSSTQGDALGQLQGTQLSAVRITSYADMIGTRELAEAVADKLADGTTAADLDDKVTAEIVPDTFIIEISARDPSPERSQLIAQTFAETFIVLIDNLEPPTTEGRRAIKATVFSSAQVPSSPASPKPVRNIALGLLVGIAIALVAAVVRELLDSTVRSGADLGKATTAPLLGDVPHDVRAQVRDFNDSLDLQAPGMEAYRVLRTNLQFVEVDAREKVFVVTSAAASEGKTTTAVNLAIAHSQAGQRVLLIEADLRKPRASRALGLDESVGLTTVLIGQISLAEAIQEHSNGSLHVLSSGVIPPNPAELLQSKAMNDVMASLRGRYDVIIIDAPPLLPVTDAAVLAAKADGAILVVRHARTRRDQVATAVSRLTQVDAAPIGIVINMTPSKRRGAYGYGYGYGYGETALAAGDSRATKWWKRGSRV